MFGLSIAAVLETIDPIMIRPIAPFWMHMYCDIFVM